MKEILGMNMYTVEETAEMLGVSVDTVRRYSKQDKLSGQRIGRNHYFSENALRKFLKI